MISVYKYIILKTKRHLKLELTAIFLCLLLCVTTICLVSNSQITLYIKQLQQEKFDNYYITHYPYQNDIYKDSKLDENVVAFFMEGRTDFTGGNNFRQNSMTIVETRMIECFSPQIRDEYSDTKNVAIKVYASSNLKEKYPLGSECSFKDDNLDKKVGTVVGYNYGKFMLFPDHYGSALAGVWSTDPEIVVVVDDISLLSGSGKDAVFYAICDIPAAKYATLKDDGFISIKRSADRANNGPMQAFYFYIILAVVLASILIFSINHLLYSGALKKETAVECVIGVTKKSMIIANAILLAIESVVTAILYYLIYSFMVKIGLIYASSFALGLIPLVFIIFLAMFAARVVNILRNKLLPNLHADGD